MRMISTQFSVSCIDKCIHFIYWLMGMMHILFVMCTCSCSLLLYPSFLSCLPLPPLFISYFLSYFFIHCCFLSLFSYFTPFLSPFCSPQIFHHYLFSPQGRRNYPIEIHKLKHKSIFSAKFNYIQYNELNMYSYIYMI